MLPHQFYQNSFSYKAVKLPSKDLTPNTKVRWVHEFWTRKRTRLGPGRLKFLRPKPDDPIGPG
jgi:hypothetical protein